MDSSIFYALTLAAALIRPVYSIDLPDYTGLKIAQNGSILTVTFHNPSSPINLWNLATQNDLTDLVIIFNITIGAIEGRARGAGNEFLVSLDMRFATKGESLFGQPEVGSGLFPGGGGSQFLPGLIGRGRAMEYVLSSNDITAEDAAEIGWINKAFDTSAEMYGYIGKLAQRFSWFPLSALHGGKKTINRASAPSLEQIIKDTKDFFKQKFNSEAQAIAKRSAALSRYISAVDLELNLPQSIARLYI
ncbi:ClpP/crotonase-like domain-containing protein [Colletotrichum phormii]|uniref:ClpP/crotonase-like domain-containing protein n=1 Tax=Colletotrichum phormii TaxID=359342 RepID=A0AAJ0EGF0_9PEZI|nr:ClpP/crotonase-like domain-containing protein [Colletotrichum phormii]KAK1635890.1 ClpP/crotonase-like domain-containing protein [Colletotrichum phormii]